jgi:hypothetical protein
MNGRRRNMWLCIPSVTKHVFEARRALHAGATTHRQTNLRDEGILLR